jgi:gluconokinase
VLATRFRENDGDGRSILTPCSMQSEVKTRQDARFVIVGGVSGAGKSTIAALLAARLGWTFQDGDWLHPPANVAKMRAGRPLSDEDRLPWLAAIVAWMSDARSVGRSAVIACSALKRAYREILVAGQHDVRLVFLKGSRELIEQRMAVREDHFMPASLLHSQFEALEEPGADEHVIVVSIEPSPQDVVDAILARLS